MPSLPFDPSFPAAPRGLTDASSPRRPWLAALASLVLPGLGQFYNGALNRAIWLFLVFALLTVPGSALVALYLPEGLMVPGLLIGLLLTLAVWIYAIWQAWNSARSLQEYQPRAWQLSGVYALVFVLCDLICLPMLSFYVREHQVEPFRIPSRSMEPGILQGDFIFADKRYNCPGCRAGVRRGDIAIFAYPNDRSVRYIKRVVGMPGDSIEYRNHQFWVNGKVLSDFPESTAKEAPEMSLRVPDGQVFVLGDNRSESTDSRAFGTVPMQDILGRARQVWFSIDQGTVRWNRLGMRLQ